MRSLLIILLSTLVILYSSFSCAQYTCVSSGHDVTSDLPSCDYLNNTYIQCNNLTGNALNNCVCTEKLLSSIFDCESEYRLCLDSYEEDTEMQQVLANWHSECDTFINFSPTTPVLSTPTFTIMNPICDNIDSICTFGGSITRACKETYTADSQASSLSSCLCQSSLLSAASVCEYDGNITCLDYPATLTSIDLWILCPVQASTYSNPATVTSPSVSSNTIQPAASSYPFRPPSSTPPAMGSSSALRNKDGRVLASWMLASLARFTLVTAYLMFT